MKDMTIRTQAEFRASVEEIWKLLTHEEYTRQYMFGCVPDSDWRKGTELLWKDEKGNIVVKGDIIEIETNKRLHYTTFDPNVGLNDVPENYILVTYDLEPKGNDCLLKISQGDFAKSDNAQQRYDESVQGWKYIIDAINKILNADK